MSSLLKQYLVFILGALVTWLLSTIVRLLSVHIGFSLEAFKFIADHPFVFVHCHVILCNATDPTSKCGKKCSSSGRGRREVSSHMTDDVYMLAQGPIHLGHQKRDANEGGVGQSGERLGTCFKRRMGRIN